MNSRSAASGAYAPATTRPAPCTNSTSKAPWHWCWAPRAAACATAPARPATNWRASRCRARWRAGASRWPAAYACTRPCANAPGLCALERRHLPLCVLFVITPLAHLPVCGGLPGLERLRHTDLARQRGAQLLAHGQAYRLKLGNGGKLDPGVRGLGQRLIIGIGRQDGFALHLAKPGDLLVLGAVIGRSAVAGGHGDPARLLGHQLHVVPGCRPVDEPLRLLFLLRGARNRQRPSPQPARALGCDGDRGLGEGHFVGHLAELRICPPGPGAAGIHPHPPFPLS